MMGRRGGRPARAAPTPASPHALVHSSACAPVLSAPPCLMWQLATKMKTEDRAARSRRSVGRLEQAAAERRWVSTRTRRSTCFSRCGGSTASSRWTCQRTASTRPTRTATRCKHLRVLGVHAGAARLPGRSRPRRTARSTARAPRRSSTRCSSRVGFPVRRRALDRRLLSVLMYGIYDTDYEAFHQVTVDKVKEEMASRLKQPEHPRRADGRRGLAGTLVRGVQSRECSISEAGGVLW